MDLDADTHYKRSADDFSDTLSDDVTERRPSSKWLALPEEIRLHIIEYLSPAPHLLRRDELLHTDNFLALMKLQADPRREFFKQVMALAQTCKRLHRLALSILYRAPLLTNSINSVSLLTLSLSQAFTPHQGTWYLRP